MNRSWMMLIVLALLLLAAYTWTALQNMDAPAADTAAPVTLKPPPLQQFLNPLFWMIGHNYAQ